ncbi:hypothetical protein [Faecalibacterium taiwanense]|uniref:iron-sulfur cluster-binding protein n=1 Tax=Faecalibacterium taiwanense TaxID=3030638 RepID=UPI003AAED227
MPRRAPPASRAWKRRWPAASVLLGRTCETKSGEGKSVCKNGPVFDATEVFF